MDPLAYFLGVVTFAAAVQITISSDWASISKLRHHLTSQLNTPRHHAFNESLKDRTREHILHHFNSHVQNSNGSVYRQEFSTRLHGVFGKNLILHVPGELAETSKDKPVIIAAHYDTGRETPGFDYNSSGVSVLLELVRLLLRCHCSDCVCSQRHSLVFVALDLHHGEQPEKLLRVACLQPGGCGATQFIEDWVRQKIFNFGSEPTVIVLDGVGHVTSRQFTQRLPDWFNLEYESEFVRLRGGNFSSDFVWLLGRTSEFTILSQFNDTIQQLQQQYRHKLSSSYYLWPLPLRLPLHIQDATIQQYRPLLSGDFARFWAHGIDAIGFTDTGPLRNKCFGRPCDSADVMLTDSMLEVMTSVTNLIKHWTSNRVQQTVVSQPGWYKDTSAAYKSAHYFWLTLFPVVWLSW